MLSPSYYVYCQAQVPTRWSAVGSWMILVLLKKIAVKEFPYPASQGGVPNSRPKRGQFRITDVQFVRACLWTANLVFFFCGIPVTKNNVFCFCFKLLWAITNQRRAVCQCSVRCQHIIIYNTILQFLFTLLWFTESSN